MMETAGLSKKSLLETFNTTKSKQLNELRNENEFCDLTLKSEDGFEIKVHRVVVSSASNYFKDLLTLPMKEKFEECISMPDITGDILEKIIAFIYTSEFEEKIEVVETIIKYAVIFQLAELLQICLLDLSESINDHTCVKYWRLGRINLAYGLEDKCFSYIVSKADHLLESSLMSDLTIEEMRSLLADNRLHRQCNEEKIFEHVWKWAKAKVSESKSFSQIFSEVINLFNYAALTEEFILRRIFFNDDLTENAELLQKIIKLTKQKYEGSSRPIFHKPTQRRLLGLTSKKMFIGLGEENIIEKKINVRNSFGYTTFDNKLLICGGEGKGQSSITNSCEFFEPNIQQWKEFPSMKIRKKWPECSNLDNKIYVCGGFSCKTVEIFDFGKGKWIYGPEMLAKNYNFGLTGVNGALYAIGGETDNVQILDPRMKKWNIICNSFRSVRVRCVSIGPCIYCFTYKKRYIFDTRSNKFTEDIYYENVSYDLNFCELDGYIYGFGYQQDSANKYSLNFVQYYRDEKQGFKKSYGLYDSYEAQLTSQPAIVSLYY